MLPRDSSLNSWPFYLDPTSEHDQIFYNDFTLQKPKHPPIAASDMRAVSPNAIGQFLCERNSLPWIESRVQLGEITQFKTGHKHYAFEYDEELLERGWVCDLMYEYREWLGIQNAVSQAVDGQDYFAADAARQQQKRNELRATTGRYDDIAIPAFPPYLDRS